MDARLPGFVLDLRSNHFLDMGCRLQAHQDMTGFSDIGNNQPQLSEERRCPPGCECPEIRCRHCRVPASLPAVDRVRFQWKW